LNADKPFDQFVVEQLAGDELLSPPYAHLDGPSAEILAATGFLRTAPDGTGEGGVDQATARNDVVAETIKIVSTAFLGLTVGCAQCHDHRYDPISQEDYYRLRALFEPALDPNNWKKPAARLVSLWSQQEEEQAAQVDAEIREIEGRRVAELDGIVAEIFEREVAALDLELQGAARFAKATPEADRTPEQQQLLKEYPSLNVDRGSAYLYEQQRLKDFNKKYEDQNAQTKARRPPEQMLACLFETPGQIPPTAVFYRGNPSQPKQEVSPGELGILAGQVAEIPSDDPALPTSGRRLAFARSLTSGRHPLLARVIVNRVWMHHFGKGLVASPGDFGKLGQPPTHPELLDYLADEFVHSGWSLKSLHRLILTSHCWRQSSLRSEERETADPDNRMLGRMNVRRLEAEAIRDAMLDVSGTRCGKMYGPAVGVAPDEVGQIVVGAGMRDGNGIFIGTADGMGGEPFRRSVYVEVRRSMPLGVLEPFDVAATTPNCELRTTSTSPVQSLLLMNGSFVRSQAASLARRAASEAGDDLEGQVERAWRLAFGSRPSEAETAAGAAYVQSQKARYEASTAEKKEHDPTPAERALASYCQALLSSNRFLYVD
jgi:hypothetical protein